MIFVLIYLCFAVITIICGPMIKSFYKGYLSSKDKKLSQEQDSEIDQIILMVSIFPVVILMFILAAVCEIPFLAGKLIGKWMK